MPAEGPAEGRPSRRRSPAVIAATGMLAVGLLAGCASPQRGGSPPISMAPSTAAPSSSPVLLIKSLTAVTLPTGPTDATEGPAPGQQDLALTAAGAAFLVTSESGAGSQPASGGRIQRTTDGGTRWTTVWQKPNASLYWVGTAGSQVVASGELVPPGAPSTASPLLLVSSDGGSSWAAVTPSIPSPPAGMAAGVAWSSLRLHFLTSSIGLAVPDAAEGQEISDPQILRTTDAGRQWVAVDWPGGTPNGGLAFISPMVGFATGTTSKCPGQIWGTVDGGATWQAVPGTCVGYVLDALSFPDGRDGFAAGGNYYKYGFYPQLALLASTDGGRHWTSRYAQGGSRQGGGPGQGPFAQLHFVTPTVGYALTGGCVTGANGPCGGALWSSTDGGRTWTKSSASGLRLATDGSQDLWLVDPGPTGGDVLWHSDDGAATWTPVADPANVDVSGLVASGDTLWIATEAGQFTSDDGGRTWAPLAPAARQAEQRTYGRVLAIDGSGLLVVGNPGSSQLWISHDGGRSGQTVSLPGLGPFGVVAVAFADDRHGLVIGQGSLGTKNPGGPGAPVLATGDGGSTWRQTSMLDTGMGSLGYGSNVAVVVNPKSGPLSPATVATSTDQGARWHLSSLPDAYPCFDVTAAGDTAVMFCTNVTTTGGQRATVLVTRDAGRDWNSYRFEGSQLPSSVVAAGSGQLWAAGHPGLLWHSNDGGAHWTALTLSLPVSDRAV